MRLWLWCLPLLWLVTPQLSPKPTPSPTSHPSQLISTPPPHNKIPQDESLFSQPSEGDVLATSTFHQQLISHAISSDLIDLK